MWSGARIWTKLGGQQPREEAQALLRLFFIGSSLRKAQLRSPSSQTGQLWDWGCNFRVPGFSSHSGGWKRCILTNDFEYARCDQSQVQHIMCGIISEAAELLGPSVLISKEGRRSLGIELLMKCLPSMCSLPSFTPQPQINRYWRAQPEISAFRRWKQEDLWFKVFLDYLVRLAWVV